MRRQLVVALLLVVAPVLSAKPATFVIDDPSGRNRAEFSSDAPIERMIGQTGAIYGEVTVDSDDLSLALKATVTVDLRTLKTGIEKRDEHMHSADYLDTDKFPDAVFEAAGPVTASTTSLAPGQPVPVTLFGKFTVHGVTRPVTVTGKATFFQSDSNLAKFGYPGELLNFAGDFAILLADYRIKRPELLLLKLSEEVEIHINFTATTGRTLIQR